MLTGAGVSRESGLATFRDAQDGLWAKYDPMELATLDAYQRNPEMVWDWYEYRFGKVATARPNPGHLAIAAMERIFRRVTVITQNVDGLHQDAGSSDVIELHGSIRRYRCLSGRHAGYGRNDWGTQPQRPPHCPECGQLLRPEVVWFGEMLPQAELERAIHVSESYDAMLVVGTSGEVQPAASLPFWARAAGATVVDVNPERGSIANAADVHLSGPGGDILPALLRAIEKEA